jgi:tRNA A-37 threonylcarbamoyl transferase component Bud32
MNLNLFELIDWTILLEMEIVNGQLSLMEKCLNSSHIQQIEKFDKIFIKNYQEIFRNQHEFLEKDEQLSDKLLEFKEITLRHLQVKKQFRIVF